MASGPPIPDGVEELSTIPARGKLCVAGANATEASHIPAKSGIHWRKPLDSIDQLVADWIQVRATLKRQLKHFAEGNSLSLPNQVRGRLTEDATERLHRCVTEIEVLIAHYSSRG